MYSKNPVVTTALTKVAAVPAWYKDPGFTGAVAGAAVPFLLQGAASGVRKLFQARQKAQAFKSTLERNPHLKSFDAKSTQRYFNTLHRVSPDMAQDPTVAGAFIHSQHELSDASFPHRGIVSGAVEMAGLQKDVMGARPSAPSFKGVGDVASAATKALAQEQEGRQAAFNEASSSFKQSSLRQVLGL